MMPKFIMVIKVCACLSFTLTCNKQRTHATATCAIVCPAITTNCCYFTKCQNFFNRSTQQLVK